MLYVFTASQKANFLIKIMKVELKCYLIEFYTLNANNDSVSKFIIIVI